MSGKVTLNRRLVLEDPVDLPDGAGGMTRNWTAVGTLWADIRQLSARELELQELPVSSARCRITLRAAPFGAPSRPRAGQRFVEGQRVYRIIAVSEAGSAQKYVVAHAREETVQ